MLALDPRCLAVVRPRARQPPDDSIWEVRGGGQHFVRICIWRMDTFTPGTFTAMTSTSTELSMEPLVFLS